MSDAPRILVLFAHPRLQRSRVNRMLLAMLQDEAGVTVRDLYDAYPDFNVDVKAEQALLLEHDVIVFQHPLYWYSCPSLMKEWIDLVLEYGFAFGSEGRALEGKAWMQAITAGGGMDTYASDGMNRHTLRQFLAPFEQTANLCHMRFVAPFVVAGTHRHFEREEIVPYVERYRDLLRGIASGAITFEDLEGAEHANDLLGKGGD